LAIANSSRAYQVSGSRPWDVSAIAPRNEREMSGAHELKYVYSNSSPFHGWLPRRDKMIVAWQFTARKAFKKAPVPQGTV
jgi:hypothetical protein